MVFLRLFLMNLQIILSRETFKVFSMCPENRAYILSLGLSANVLALIDELDLELGKAPVWFRQICRKTNKREKYIRPICNVHFSNFGISETLGRLDF